MHVLELLNAVHPLGLLGRVQKAAKRRLEVLATRPVRHAAQARAVPVDLARLRVERALLAGLGFECRGGSLRRCGVGLLGAILGGLLCGAGLDGGGLGARLDLLALLGEDGVDGRDIIL